MQGPKEWFLAFREHHAVAGVSFSDSATMHYEVAGGFESEQL